MENKMIEKEKLEGKAGLNTAILPWWARVLIAQHTEAAFPTADRRHIHHCSDCGCVLISTNMAYQYSSGLCPECSTKKQKSQGGN